MDLQGRSEHLFLKQASYEVYSYQAEGKAWVNETVTPSVLSMAGNPSPARYVCGNSAEGLQVRADCVRWMMMSSLMSRKGTHL